MHVRNRQQSRGRRPSPRRDESTRKRRAGATPSLSMREHDTLDHVRPNESSAKPAQHFGPQPRILRPSHSKVVAPDAVEQASRSVAHRHSEASTTPAMECRTPQVSLAMHVENLRSTYGRVRLVVGGQQATAVDPQCAEAARNNQPFDVSINIDRDAHPHLWGDIACRSSMLQFEPASFTHVVFQRVGAEAFTSTGNESEDEPCERYFIVARRGLHALNHAARVLMPGGRLEIISGGVTNAQIREVVTALGHGDCTIDSITCDADHAPFMLHLVGRSVIVRIAMRKRRGIPAGFGLMATKR